MLNTINIMGRLTRDPELRHAGEVPVCSFTIACDRDYKNGNGEKATDFVDVVAWRTTAEFVHKFFSKGRTAVIDGRLQIRNWTDKEGVKRRNAEILADNVYFGDSKPNTDGAAQPAGSLPNAGDQSGTLPGDFVPNFDDSNWPV